MKFLKFLIFSFFISPFIILFLKIGSLSSLSFGELFFAIKHTTLQAFLSSLLSLCVGFCGALSLLSLKSTQKKRVFEVLIFIPAFLPSLFVVLSFMNFSSSEGLWPVIITHTLMNAGFVSVVIFRLIERKMSFWLSRAYLEKSSPFIFCKKIILPYLKKDFFLIFISIFAFCFTSFTVPFLLGGLDFLTIETLIYEKIKIEGLWAEGLSLALFESFFLAFFFFFIREGDYSQITINRGNSPPFFKTYSGLLVLLIFLFFVLIFNLPRFFIGFKRISFDLLIDPLVVSFFIAFFVGAFCFFMLCLISFCFHSLFYKRNQFFKKFLSLYMAPSTAILGFSYLLLYSGGSIMALILALSLSFLPQLYRLGGKSTLNDLQKEVSLSYMLQASRFFTFRKVIFPKTSNTFGFLAGLASFWAAGDFGLSAILLETKTPLSLLAQSFLKTYRLEEATCVSWLMMILGFFVFLFWRFLGYVFSERSEFRLR